MDDGNSRSHVMMMQGGSNTMLGMMPMLQGMSLGNSSTDMRHLSSHNKTDKDSLTSSRISTYNRRTKVRTSNKSENIKGDDKVILLHTRVQDSFAANLVTLISDQEAQNLQCCVTYGKPCGCIRKYILAGPQWKESSTPNLRITAMKDKELDTIVGNDFAMLGEVEVTRAKELLDILRHAAELKKEKCYVTTENVDGKPVKELRGMIGLGNGRKRSKKYEDFVLDKRAKLREEYFLCEKAAQKLLGYSINFLYKKLRTNPERTSRLVATNKAERAAKGPRNLIPLEQLRSMANNQQSANQCCCRNCISWLVKQHFDKIANWRKRLEGSGQRVAQEIVAEVLLVSASLDGQNSFCQNLVHWVTGCSFKKIRRVRDHLKKDPKSLPEHGLKKYWKEKGRKSKPRADDQSKSMLLKTEKRESFATGGQGLERFPMSYDARGSDPSNLNNSNNRYGNDVQYVPEAISPPPPNRTLPTGVGTMFSAQLSRARHHSRETAPPAYQQMQRPVQHGHSSSQPIYMTPENGNVGTSGGEINTPYPVPSFNPALHVPNSFPENAESNYNPNNQGHYKGTMTVSDGQGSSGTHPPGISAQTSVHGRPSHEGDTTQYSDPHPPQHDASAGHSKFHPAPFIGFADPGANIDHGQGYYFAANPGNSQEGFVPAAPIPFFVTQAQQMNPNNPEQDGNAPSQFFILSPAALPNSSDINGGDFDNLKSVALTPIPMYPASYFHGGAQGEDKNTEAQHFVFSATDPHAAFHGHQASEQDNDFAVQQQTSSGDGGKRPYGQGGQEQAYFQPLTPLAVMQPQTSGFFSGWIASHSVPISQVHSSEHKRSDSSEHFESQQKYYGDEAAPGQGPYFKTENTQLPALSQWASANQPYANTPQQTNNQWMGQHNTPQETKKPFVQQPTSQTPVLQSNPSVDGSDSKGSLRSQMPPLAPLQNSNAKQEQKLPDVHAFSSSLQNAEAAAENALPKAASISNRSKRFSRDRLGANIDSPGIILPPMTPLTPVAYIPGLRSSSSNIKAENLSVSTSNDQPTEDSVFRFPPTYIGPHAAALRVQDLSNSNDPKQDLVVTSGEKLEESGKVTENASNATSSSTSSVSGDTGIMVSLSNVKPVPVLSLPTFPDESSDSKPKTSESQSDQQLQTPTAVLNTPTHQLTPSHLSTPTHQLHTPNQALNTPTQPLNTPTQPLSTPTQVTSPSSDDQSPLKPLMPAPSGKKRRADSVDIEKSPKQSRPESSIKTVREISQFRKPVDAKPSGSSTSAELRQKASERPKPPSPVETIEVVDDDDSDRDKALATSNESTTISSNTSQSSASTKSAMVKRIPPIFSLPSGPDGHPLTPSSQTQLNTPVLVPSGVFAGKMNTGLLRRGSGSDRGVASTPQFFTFMPPSSGFSSPMFFAHLDQIDPKFKQAKGKPSDNCSDDSSEKHKSSPQKRVGMTLNLSSKSLVEDGLQTPSKIPVVTPSAIIGASMAEVPQMFNFQDVPLPHRASGTPEKSKNAKPALEKHESSSDAAAARSKKFRLPSLVVDPPSDNEDNDKPSSMKISAAQNQSKPDQTDKPSPAKTPPVSTKPSLHRTRSGSSKDLVLSLNNVNSPDADSVAEPATSSPLNTPSGIQVITPTLPGSKSSPVRRGTPRMRGRPKPIMMTPICLTPGSATPQVATPTFFHIVSPNQVPPSSPSVLMYPYPTRGSGPLSTGSIASPAFGFFQKGAAQASGSNSASLLKSALMRKIPVFQFPPPVPASTPTSDSTSSEKASDSKDLSRIGDQEHPKSVSETSGLITISSSANAESVVIDESGP